MNIYSYNHKGFDADDCYVVLAQANSKEQAFKLIGNRIGNSVLSNISINDIEEVEFDSDSTFELG